MSNANTALEAKLVHPPPDSPPAGVPGVREGQPGLHAGIGERQDSDARLTRNELLLERLLKRLEQGQFFPELKTIGFSTNVAGFGNPAAPNLIIPPTQGSNAIYICGLWFSAAAALSIGFGQGTSSLDAEFFPSSLGLSPAVPLAVNGNFSMTAARPNWVFRCDPGKGFMLNTGAGGAIVAGWASFYVADVAKERPADLS